MNNYGFLRVAAAVPVVKVADTDTNADRICALISEASSREVSLVVFPELSVTGYTCGDLFGQQLLVRKAEKAVVKIMEHTRGKDITAVVGAPVRFADRLYNCAVVIRNGNNSSAEMTVGHILLTKIEIVASDGRSWPSLAVAPLSVLPGFQRMGIGGMLIREAHKRAAKLGYSTAVLLGHKDYYPKFGYKKASLFGIKFPFDVPDDYCMVVELQKEGLKKIHGTVHYPDAFQV